ncbi:tripartite ATP-independent transporter DctP family solute receptor [Natronocella acetinitrilica]|uniref:Tripartite ATP-independent transporter DctP family solute receptor n=1 Tax=Natronocella acetinitrilica TaxID=414046 RepID=A0AAE3G464_9GAMM|nr:TRAP transporter substrate-binding protein [Natronocella acetinitrilica]MCP1673587.1 tripartite ATP-independent transporter DctP family solute receptor [Natronocella acetinitrilica]
MHKKLFLNQLFTGLMGASVLAFAGGTAADTINMRANTIGAEGGIQMEGLRTLKQVVEDRTGGQVNIRLHHSGALGDQESDLESLRAGTLDISTIETPITSVDPVLGLLSLPYLFRDREHVEAVLSGPVGDEFRERLQERGYRVLGFYEGGFRHITNSRRPIVEPDDLRGVRMRTPGSPLRIRIFNHYGADAAPLPYPELYSALQTGVFDGQENPLVEVRASRFYEVQDYLSLSGHVYTVGFILMGEERFQSLPEDVQQALLEGGEAGGAATVAFGREADESVVELAEGRGMQVNDVNLDAFIEASSVIWDDEAERLGGSAAELIEAIVNTETP